MPSLLQRIKNRRSCEGQNLHHLEKKRGFIN